MPRHSAHTSTPTIVLFDGDCPLCERTVEFARRRDPRSELRFLALQSPQARAILARRGLPAGQLNSLILIEESRVSLRSTAALRLCLHLSMPWPMFALAQVVPRPLRDWCYSFFARHRHFLRPSPAHDRP